MGGGAKLEEGGWESDDSGQCALVRVEFEGGKVTAKKVPRRLPVVVQEVVVQEPEREVQGERERGEDDVEGEGEGEEEDSLDFLDAAQALCE